MPNAHFKAGAIPLALFKPVHEPASAVSLRLNLAYMLLSILPKLQRLSRGISIARRKERKNMRDNINLQPAITNIVPDEIARGLLKRQLNPRVDVETIAEGFRPVVTLFAGRANSISEDVQGLIPVQRRRRPHAFFCEDESYSASCFIENSDYIALKMGLVLRPFHIYECMLSCDTLWPNVQDKTVRTGLALMFMWQIFDFIVLHEIAHLALGHLDKDAIEARTDPIAQQALEFAADGYAAWWGFVRLGRMSPPFLRTPLVMGGLNCKFRHERYEDLLHYFLALYFVFRMGDKVTWDERTLGLRTHPPDLMRFHTVCIHLNEYWKSIGNRDALDQLLRVQSEVWSMGETMFAQTLGRQPEVNLRDRIMSDACEAHYERISNRARLLPAHLLSLA